MKVYGFYFTVLILSLLPLLDHFLQSSQAGSIAKSEGLPFLSMASCATISLQELTFQPKQARVAGTCVDHNFFYMDSLCLNLSNHGKEDAMNKNNDEKLITRHRVRS